MRDVFGTRYGEGGQRENGSCLAAKWLFWEKG